MKWQYRYLYAYEAEGNEWHVSGLEAQRMEIKYGNMEDMLNKLGKDGWELAAVIHTTPPWVHFFLKRPVEE